MNVHVGNASVVECICECCKVNCVTNVTNETVCSDIVCLMWPHGLSVRRTDGRLVSTACANSGESNRRSGDRFCRHHVSSRRHFGHIGSLSCESPGESSLRYRRCGRGPMRRVIVSSRTSREDFSPSRSHSSRIMVSVASYSHVVMSRDGASSSVSAKH